RRALREGWATTGTRRAEWLVLGGLTMVGLAAVGYALYQQRSLLAPGPEGLPIKTLLVGWVGAGAGTLALLLRRRAAAGAAVPAEGVMLGAMLLAYVGLGALTWPRGPAAAGDVRVAWEFRPPDKGQFLSSPLVAGDRVWIAAAHTKG